MSASVRAASAASPASAASDLALLRAAPARVGNGAREAATGRPPGDGGASRSADDDVGDAHSDSAAAPAASPPAETTAQTQAPASRSAFGATLAASMSASSSSTSAPTPARSTKLKTTDPKAAPGQAAAGLVLPAAPPAAALATLAPPGTASGAANAPASDAPGSVAALQGGPGSSAGSDASDEPAPAPAPTASPAAAAETGARATDALALDVAQLPGLKPLGERPAGNPTHLSDELEGPEESPEAPAAPSPAAAAAILATHAPLIPLPASSGHGQGGSPADGESGSPGTGSGDSGTEVALGTVGGAGSSPQPAAAATATSGSPASIPVHAEVGSGAWAQELGVRLNWMAQAGISSASLKLTPAQLGPVEVRISVHQNTASVWFGAAQPETRSALEQALPKLREMFSAQGMNLAHTGVSDQSAQSTPREPEPAVARAPAVLRELNATPVTARLSLHQGLVDTYA